MTKKAGRKSSRSGARRTKRRNKSLKSRSVIIVIGFLALVATVLYGLNYLKKEVAINSNGHQNDVLNTRISEVDKSIYEAFFRLGISKNDILKESVNENKADGFSWKTKNQTVFLRHSFSKNNINDVFKELVADDGDTNFSIDGAKGSYVSKININGYNTHIINFDSKKQAKKKPPVKKTPPAKKKVKSVKADPVIPKNKKVIKEGARPYISIIVDDVGIDKKAVDRLVNISNDITFAILPNRTFSLYAAEKAGKNNIEILLHQPMEPKLKSGYTADDAGEGVLLLGQTKEDIISTLNKNISAMPGAVGVNNHMGSKFTENEELMKLIMKTIKEKDLIFVDSLTSPRSKGYDVARDLGVRTARRDIFLDDKNRGKSYVKRQLRKLVATAQKNGYAIGICHTYPQTIEALREEIPKISEEVNITPVNKLLNQ